MIITIMIITTTTIIIIIIIITIIIITIIASPWSFAAFKLWCRIQSMSPEQS